MEQHYNITEARAAQEKYCMEHGTPHFAPWSGNCFRCGSQIYGTYPNVKGYSVEYAGSHLITGCPFCGTSYVD